MINENALKLLNEKQYFQDGEKTWEDICSRVSSAIASAETKKELKKQVKEDIYNAMTNLEFIFSTPCLLNAHETNGGQLSSCFVLPLKDNIESICQIDAEYSKIFQKNGGAGASMSALRPAKTNVNTSKGYAGGVIAFMEKYDSTADTMTKHNPSRKGAIKKNLAIWHPQIKDFLHCKDTEGKLERMNISVSFTDDFMKAVQEDKEWNLEFPDYTSTKEFYDKEWNGNLEEWKSKGYPTKIYETVKARDLFKEFSECSWNTGEPGANFQDTMNRDNMNKHLYLEINTNPCLHKDTYMVTENGLEKISRIKSNIWNGKSYVSSKTWKTGIKKVYRIMTKSGYEYVTTADHKFLLKDGSWCNAIDLLGKDIAFEIKEKNWKGTNPYPQINYEVLGFEFGDGTFHKASDRMKYIFANPEKDAEVIKLIENEFKDSFYPANKKKAQINHIINIPYGTVYANAFYDKIENRLVPDWIMTLPKNEMRAFLKGLFSANGCNLKDHHRIQLVSINVEMLKQIQQMLLMFGIKGKLWYHNKKDDIEFDNGVYTCKQSAHIVISRDSYKKFLDEIGFIQEYKNGYLDYKNKEDQEFETVILISELDEAEVWDFTEEELHMGVTNGAYVHNCNEFTNIPYSSCNLGSINLVKCYENGSLNLDKLKSLTKKAVRWLDNMITVNKLPLKKIDEVTKQIRPIGLGIMGLGELFYILKIKYNSKEGYELAENIIETMKEVAIQSSMKLAEEKGTYLAWEGSEWQKKGIKVRNCNMLSIAPTGTLSFIASTSGGCEPVFALTFSRRTYDGTLYYVTNQIFKQELENRGIYSDELMSKIEKNHGSCVGLKEIPKDIQEIFVTAHDIKPIEHVKMVSVLQKHVDLSISKTVNFSNNATLKDIMDIYLEAWKMGLKGLSVYRDGCRKNQTLSTNRDIDKECSVHFDTISPIDKEVLGETYGTNVKESVACGKLYLSLFRDDKGNLSEMFINTSKGGICQSNVNAISRLVSLALRSGIKVDEICDQLIGIKCPACSILRSQGKITNLSCPDTVGKYILEKYKQGDTVIVEKTPRKKKKVKNEKLKCPNCGEEMRMEAGCQVCNCGYSLCS